MDDKPKRGRLGITESLRRQVAARKAWREQQRRKVLKKVKYKHLKPGTRKGIPNGLPIWKLKPKSQSQRRADMRARGEGWKL